MKCPYCYKHKCEPDVVSINIENYGSKIVKFKCVHCKKVIKAYGERRAVFSKPIKTNEESDW